MFEADVENAFGVGVAGISGTCRVGYGPPLVMAPFITASIAACG